MRVGNYTLTNLLGRGGTSEVYAAEHRFLGDAVAVKLLRPSLANDDHVREAFVAEAARTREVQHPNVIRVIDFGHDETSGSCYLVMERIEGETLSARLRRVGKLDEPALRTLGATIADGMQAAHARGIVHRDLKPGNIMLRGDAPTIVDFGIAKSLGSTSAVVTERRVGTVAYMAPEQLTDGLITPAVDIWALGVILYEAATGQPPFANFNDGRLPQLFDTPPRAATLAPISPALDDLIMRCLDRDPGKRPMAMENLARELRGESDERVTEDIGPRVSSASPPPSSRRRRRLWPFAVAGAALLSLPMIDMMVNKKYRPDEQRTPLLPVAVPERVEPPQPAPAMIVIDAGVAAPEPERSEPRSKPKRAHANKPKTTSQGETLD